MNRKSIVQNGCSVDVQCYFVCARLYGAILQQQRLSLFTDHECHTVAKELLTRVAGHGTCITVG
jgi:hypothetical protein